MKVILILFLAGSAASFGSNSIRSKNVLGQARELLTLHELNCGGTHGKGWWLDVSTRGFIGVANGSIDVKTGDYAGCGHCEECRKLASSTALSAMEQLKADCENVGATVTKVNTDSMEDHIASTSWWFKQTGNVVCKRWVPCE